MSMRISELSRTAGVPLPTVKYYLREGLLPAGRPTATTQAEYDQSHVDRLRLVRALVAVGGLSLTAVAKVLAVLDQGGERLPEAIGEAHTALVPVLAGDGPDDVGPPVRALALMHRLGWRFYGLSPMLRHLDAALAATEQVGVAPSEATLDRYAAAALAVAEGDIDGIPMPDGGDAVAYVVLATVLYEPILLALRRLAQAHVFTERHDPATGAGSVGVDPHQ